MKTYGVTFPEDVKYRSCSLCQLGLARDRSMTSFKVPGIASILCNYEVYWSIWDSPHPHWLLCHHGFSWKALFIYLAWKHHCLPQTQFNFLLYSIGLALSDFWLKPQLKSTCDEQSLKRPKSYWKERGHMLQTIPQVNFQRDFEEDNTHLQVWVLGHLQNNINTPQMGK